MSYTTVETATVNVIRKHADFDADHCKAADGKMFGKGLARFCLVSYNSDRTQELTIKVELRIWLLNIDVFVPWRGDLAELEQRVDAEVQKVKDMLAKYPRLDAASGVTKAILATGNPKDVLQVAKGSYRGKRSILEVQEAVDPARSE